MDIEEKLCDQTGRLMYRNTPSDSWHYYSVETLSAMLIAERKQREAAMSAFERAAQVVADYMDSAEDLK